MARIRLLPDEELPQATRHQDIDDAFFDRMRSCFTEPDILGMMAGQYIGFGRLLMVLDLMPKFCPSDGEVVV